MNSQKFYLDVSWVAILKVAISIFVLYLLYLTGPLLVWILFALIISMLFATIINFLERKKIPRGIAVVFVYGSIFSLMGFLIYLIAPIFIYELQKFFQHITPFLGEANFPLRGLGIEALQSIEGFIATIDQFLTEIAADVFSAIFAIFGGIFATTFVIMIGIFLSLERKPIEKALVLLSPRKYEKELLRIWNECQKKVSGWFLSRVVSCLFVAVASYFAFIFLGIDYPFSLSFLAGFLNFIPIIGPLLTGALIFLTIVFENFFIAVLAVLIFTLIQQLENNILSPLLTKKFVGLSPVLTLIALAIGGELWGLLGAILAVPLFAVIAQVTKELLKLKKGEDLKVENLPPESQESIIL